MQPGQSIFSADLFAARNKLARLEWIASAEVHRRYPDAIFVTLVEKRPFALWQTPPDAQGQTAIALVERNGSVITTSDVEKFRRLPKLVGEGAPQAAADLVDAVQDSSRRFGPHRRLRAGFPAPLEPDPGRRRDREAAGSRLAEAATPRWNI